MYLWLNPAPPDWITPFDQAEAAGDCARQVELAQAVAEAGDPVALVYLAELIDSQRCGDLAEYELESVEEYQEDAYYFDLYLEGSGTWTLFVFRRLARFGIRAATSDTFGEAGFHARHFKYSLVCLWPFHRLFHIDPALIEAAMTPEDSPPGPLMRQRQACALAADSLARESYFETTLPRDLDLIDELLSADFVREYLPADYIRGRMIVVDGYTGPPSARDRNSSLYGRFNGESDIKLVAYEDYLPAQLFLAQAYENGLYGYELNPVRAHIWYGRAQENGAEVDDKIRELEEIMAKLPWPPGAAPPQPE